MILNPGTIIAKRYEILDKIGTGGMANVYRAHDEKLDRFVTVKIMKEEYINDEEFLTRFGIEARAAGGLTHHNIVGIYDVGQEGNINYIVMEYVDGITLKDHIVAKAPFDDKTVIGVALRIAEGLNHAHANGVIHRDIKPQNILVSNNLDVKVTDFGIARNVSADTVTTTGNTMGSVHYFSPEQARGGNVDFKSDIYCLGIVMYEMVTGELPFDADNPVAIAMKQINDPLPDIQSKNPNTSDHLARIIRKATEKLSRHRYQSAEELLVDLKKASVRIDADSEVPTPVPGIPQNVRPLSQSPTEEARTQKFKGMADQETKAINPNEIRHMVPKRHEVGSDTGDIDLVGKPNKKRKNKKEENKGVGIQPMPIVDERMERRVKVAAVLTSVVIIAVIVVMGVNILPNFLPDMPDPIYPVPSFAGLNMDQANDLATNIAISLIEVGAEFSEEFAEGLIVSQSVAGGGNLYPGGALNVILSRGDERLPVPSFVNMDMDEAFGMIGESDFGLGATEYEHSEIIAINIVMQQTPAAGDMAHPGTAIGLVVSLGPSQQAVMVPDVVGMTEERAINEIQGTRLVVANTSRTTSDSVPQGVVISQSIEPDQEVGLYTAIGLVVSDGPPEPAPEPEPPLSPDPPTPPDTEGPAQVTAPIVLSASGVVPEDVDVVRIRVTQVGTDVVIYDDNVPTANLPNTILVPVDNQFMVEIMGPVHGEMLHQYITSPN